MASRRLNCRWCGVPSLVPVDSQNLYCQACRRFTVFQGYYSGYPPSGSSGNANFMSSDTYVTNPGYTAYGRTYQPVNSGGVYRVQPQLYAPAAHGCKRAVLCGITYKGHKHSLNGSINDVLYMKKLLADRFGFPHSSILVLTGAATGALTYSFVQTLEQESRLTYGHLLMVMHKRISAAREKVGLNSNAPHLSQEPQLSSSHKFDIHSKPFTL
ncbi:hypothetical protein MIMGU_mgv11b011416mg [Erythranthe guttata]|uniref:Uncharacterized protein n=1 Tax=Erythranthe guttata TaxID=4155 RepID=A0A022PRU8_ERYGU|nr:hypothetical protein MIMGU_mgv11b011416mg [Erythranthe guttata]